MQPKASRLPMKGAIQPRPLDRLFRKAEPFPRIAWLGGAKRHRKRKRKRKKGSKFWPRPGGCHCAANGEGWGRLAGQE